LPQSDAPTKRLTRNRPIREAGMTGLGLPRANRSLNPISPVVSSPISALSKAMRRRDFISAVVGAATVWPLAARAQKSPEMRRLAIVHPSNPVTDLTESGNPRYVAFFKELRQLGYVEGQNVAVERYSGEGRTEHYAELASKVVGRNPDLIVTNTSRLVLNFKAATTTIPIVGLMADPVRFGIVESLARPGGNITGVSTDAGLEIWGKRLDLLREAVPGILKVGYLASRDVWEFPITIEVLQGPAERMGISLIGPPLEGTLQEQEYQRVFEALAQSRPDALIVGDQAENLTYQRIIIDLAAKSGLPALYPYREQAEAGGLMAYAPELLDLYRRAAGCIGEILNGAKPSDIPIYLASKFELVINLKTAKKLGLPISPSLLARADEVIE
jgi:putative tryptophan/tyrosine transport system substrate-binding protein